MYRIREVVRETSLGPRSYFYVEKKGWFGWRDAFWDSSAYSTLEEARQMLKVLTTPEQEVIHKSAS